MVVRSRSLRKRAANFGTDSQPSVSSFCSPLSAFPSVTIPPPSFPLNPARKSQRVQCTLPDFWASDGKRNRGILEPIKSIWRSRFICFLWPCFFSKFAIMNTLQVRIPTRRLSSSTCQYRCRRFFCSRPI